MWKVYISTYLPTLWFTIYIFLLYINPEAARRAKAKEKCKHASKGDKSSEQIHGQCSMIDFLKKPTIDNETKDMDDEEKEEAKEE